MIKHYTAIADSVDLPIILYNVPGRTGVNITPATVEKLSKIENIVAIKEASGNISQVAEIARLCGENFAIYSGNDDQIVPILSLGGIGVISVLANVLPKETHDIVEKYLSGDVEESRKLQLRLNELVNSLFIEVNPIPVKAAMNLMGMEAGELRLPLTDISEQNLEVLKRLGELKVLGYPILLGTSRKSVIGNTLDLPPQERVEGTIATTVLGIKDGVDIVRVHDVEKNLRAAKMADAIYRG